MSTAAHTGSVEQHAAAGGVAFAVSGVVVGDVTINPAPADPAETGAGLLREGLELLTGRDYPQARSRFERCLELLPPAEASAAADAYYYLAIAMLGGRSLEGFDLGRVRAVEQCLRQSAQRHPACPHTYAVWSIVKEEYYDRLCGYGPDHIRPSIAELRRRVAGISQLHSAEIVQHLPASQSPTWQRLKGQ